MQIHWISSASFAFFLISCIFPLSNASIGDQSPHFRHCIARCTGQFGCPTGGRNAAQQFAWWAREPCFRCRQQCIWLTVEQFRARGQPIPQFHGKWPFVPFTTRIDPFFVAVQEPASVLFSLLNAFTFWRMMARIVREIRPDWYCRAVWLNFGRVGLFTWFCSTIFHCCDHWTTEMLDYCSVFGLILYTLYATLRFILPQWNLARIGRFGSFNRRIFRPIELCLLFFYVRYLHSMYSASRFDYGLHIRCCIFIGLSTALLYLCWAFWECRKGMARPSMLILLAAFTLGLFSASFDAFFDFPPLFWLFDAHSLFHLFSAPIPLLWAKFICQEAGQEGNQKKAENANEMAQGTKKNSFELDG